ncbi:hypothetical protein EYC80_008140 [Monilinia laxa]|uniref:Uncharacterized protein n=1 Tax=Monilinia laxa TaxID=61186 RepID=A0A5N6JVM7_MONLA|nr:hypothetical protein EYC80_008140 [Monilinia laxa]
MYHLPRNLDMWTHMVYPDPASSDNNNSPNCDGYDHCRTYAILFFIILVPVGWILLWLLIVLLNTGSRLGVSCWVRIANVRFRMRSVVFRSSFSVQQGEIPIAGYSPYDTLVHRVTSKNRVIFVVNHSTELRKRKNFFCKMPSGSPHEVQSPLKVFKDTRKDHTNFFYYQKVSSIITRQPQAYDHVNQSPQVVNFSSNERIQGKKKPCLKAHILQKGVEVKSPQPTKPTTHISTQRYPQRILKVRQSTDRQWLSLKDTISLLERHLLSLEVTKATTVSASATSTTTGTTTTSTASSTTVKSSTSTTTSATTSATTATATTSTEATTLTALWTRSSIVESDWTTSDIGTHHSIIGSGSIFDGTEGNISESLRIASFPEQD